MVLAFLRGLCILYLSLIEITLCKFVETSLVANGYHPVSKTGEETAGAERSDYEPKTLVQTGRAGQIIERFPFLKAQDIHFLLALPSKVCILYI